MLLITVTELPGTGPSGDAALVAQARRDPRTFAELYRRHVQAVYRFHLARTGLPAEAEDLTSETFLAALGGLPSYRGTGSFAAWLFGIARRKLALHYRSRVHWDPLEEAEALPDPVLLPEAQAARRLQFGQVRRALQEIAPERAEALALRYFAGLNAAEAGQVMGKSEAAVKMLVSRGLDDLYQRCAVYLQEAI